MMKKIDLIFDVFSRRRNPTGSALPKLTETFRNRVLLLCRDTFSGKNNPYSYGNYLESFWNEIHVMFTYRLGRPRLELSRASDNLRVDALSFLATCKDEEFLDFIEYIFKVDCLFHVVNDKNEFVAQINKFFALDELGYELTDYITEHRPSEGRFGGTENITVAWPQVIRKDEQSIHETAIKPTLHFLSNPLFKSANLEYLEALQAYRRGEWGNSLTKCCCAFESVMKVICDKKGWKYQQGHAARPLIEAIISNAAIETHFEQPLVFIAWLRNNYGSAHGAGTSPKMATESLALLGINLTASAILFLSKETL